MHRRPRFHACPVIRGLGANANAAPRRTVNPVNSLMCAGNIMRPQRPMNEINSKQLQTGLSSVSTVLVRIVDESAGQAVPEQ